MRVKFILFRTTRARRPCHKQSMGKMPVLRLGWFDDLVDRTSGETDFGVGAFIDLDQDFVIPGLDNGAKDSADGFDAVAELQLLEHALSLTFLGFFAPEEEEVENHQDDGDDEERTAEEIKHLRLGGGSARGGLAGLCENLEGDRQVCSLKSAHCFADAPRAAGRRVAMCSVIVRRRMAPTSTAGRDAQSHETTQR